MFVRFGFSTKPIGERGSPLQYDNYFVAFIKLYLTYIFFCYLRASDERPYGVAIILLYSEIRIKENGVRNALRFLMPTKNKKRRK